MPSYRAHIATGLALLFVLVAASWIGFAIKEGRDRRIASDLAAMELAARRESALKLEASRRENIPARRFVPPDPIVAPFY